VIGAATQPIVSRYGRRAVLWDNAKLSEVVTRLQSERERHDIRVGADGGEAEHNALITETEQMKRATENQLWDWLTTGRATLQRHVFN
jgi:hypothetical protein